MWNDSDMNTKIPSAATVRALLEPLTNSQLQTLAKRSGVPFGTLWKVRSGETSDPRLETVRKVLAHIRKAA